MKPYIRKIMPFIILQIAADFVCTLLSAMFPYLQKQLFDSDYKLAVILWYAVFHILDVVINYFALRFTWSGAIHLEKNLKNNFFSTLLGLQKEKFYKRDIGTYLSWQNNDLSALEQDYLQPLIDIIRSVNMFLIYGVVIFVLVDWRIGVVIFCSSLLTVVGPKLIGDRMAAARNDYQEKVAEYTSLVKDLLEGFTLANSSTRKCYQDTQSRSLDQMCNKREVYGKAKSLSLSINDAAVRIIQIASFAAAGILFASGKITVGICVATLGYVESFLSPMNSILYDVSALQSVSEVKKKIMDFMKVSPGSYKTGVNQLEKSICLSDVSVKFDTFSMAHMSYEFKKGKKYAIIGQSGSGKSTLLKLLTGDLRPEAGGVTVDGKPVEEIDIAKLVSCIHQNEHIFRTGYLDNVTIFGAYSKGMLPEFERRLNNPVLSNVTNKTEEDNCQELSGGEKQTIAFLRMLLENTQIVLMDEPFSAVDQKTKDIYMDYLVNERNQEGTLIMVTHELSEKLQDFDEILLLSNGKVAARGSFTEVSHSQAYINLTTSQKRNRNNI